ncbi:hypothetical protein [Mucilaginibacter sp.]|uniref:GTP pyrophosphokinase n=1 Tax=Mucilaginibacter sp. TaxID=1882438 RepID=UPI00261C556E|nr:hypothetical protein [Mucilaginibacter sp.]MDB4921220.1 hypothetical protein [Mucilaginibacter sp.]
MNNQIEIEKHIEEFKIKQELYKQFAEEIAKFLKVKIENKNVKDFSVKHRPKDLKSFAGKIKRKEYADPLNDITDLAGVRIIVCYIDQIRIIEEIISNEFLIDTERSIDKSKFLKPDTFGYLSVHYIVSISAQKKSDLSWSRFSGLLAEVQLRTNLQDSWAIVSHTLYKNENDVPDSLKRRLNRLAGIFELADQEFLEIKRANERYIIELEKKYESGEIDEIGINYYSILQFISHSHEVIEARNVAKSIGMLNDQSVTEHYNKIDCSNIVELCKTIGITSIGILEEVIKEYSRNNIKYIQVIGNGKVWSVTNGFILFLLIIKAKCEEISTDFLKRIYGWEKPTAEYILQQAKLCNDIL